MTFEITHTTLIEFGKLKGKPHKELLKQVNDNYKSWIIKQGSEFKYADTRQYIIDNCEDGEDLEMQEMLQKLTLYVSRNGFVKNVDIRDDLRGLATLVSEKVTDDVDTVEAS